MAIAQQNFIGVDKINVIDANHPPPPIAVAEGDERLSDDRNPTPHSHHHELPFADTDWPASGDLSIDFSALNLFGAVRMFQIRDEFDEDVCCSHPSISIRVKITASSVVITRTGLTPAFTGKVIIS